MKIAIITGASSGIGIEFFKEMQREALDEIWVIARRRERLEEICEKYGKIAHRVLQMDLTDHCALDSFKDLLNNQTPDVKFLFNNAGFGVIGNVIDSDYKAQGAMVDLNARALCEFTTIILPFMSTGSHIINTCSIASFVPNARMSVYSATKAFVLSYTKSLKYELKKRRISVTAICPGPMPTEFLSVAGISKGSSSAFDKLPYCDPSKVAKKGIKASKKGHTVYTPMTFYKLYRLIAKMLPHSWLIPIART